MATYTSNNFNNLPTKLRVNDIIKLTYSGKNQKLVLSKYGVKKVQIETFGARGASIGRSGGKGGYAKGDIIVSKDAELHFVVGEAGNYNKTTKSFGGGGAYGGGGATWVAKKSNPQRKEDLYLVGAGGGGAGSSRNEQSGIIDIDGGSDGGGLTGDDTSAYKTDYGVEGIRNTAMQGTQTNGGSPNVSGTGGGGGFLTGGDGKTGWTQYWDGVDYFGGGGSGLYGGGGGGYRGDRINDWNDAGFIGGGGGSSYIGGVAEGETREGYNTESNGRILIKVLETFAEFELNVIDKKEFYNNTDTIQFNYRGESQANKIDVLLKGKVIKTFTSPPMRENLQFNLSILNLPNGVFNLQFKITGGEEIVTKTEEFTKKSENMSIKSNAIRTSAKAEIVNIDLKIKEYTDIKIEVCNNAYDDAPTWEDNTNRILKGLNIYLTNKEKTNENWGLAVKITAAGEFRMSDKIRINY